MVAGIVAVASLLLPWFSMELWTKNLDTTMNFTAYLYQITGNVEGVTRSVFLVLWFTAGALVLMAGTAVTCMIAVLSHGRRGRMLLLSSFAFALLSTFIFALGLVTSNFAVENLNPGYTISQFPEGSFGISAEQSMQKSYDYSWAAGYGFWLALVVAVLSLVSAMISRKK